MKGGPIPIKWILSIIWALVVFCLSAIGVSFIDANVKYVAQEKHWDRFLTQFWEPVTSWLTALKASPWFWFLFGLILGVALGMWASRFFWKAEAKETSLQIDYEGTAANKVEGNSDVFVRARVRNTGPEVAKNARVFLTSLKEIHPGGGTTPTSLYDSKPIPWAGYDFTPRDLPSSSNVHFYVDLLRVSKHETGWIFCVQQVFASQNDLKSYNGTYRLKLTLTADNAKPATCEVDVTYFGDWHGLRAVAVSTSPSRSRHG
jgi:hypothetical protein